MLFFCGIDEVIKLPYIKALLERWAIVHFTTELSSLFNLKKKKKLFSFVQPGLTPLQSITEISGYKTEKLFINIMEGFLSCLLLEV